MKIDIKATNIILTEEIKDIIEQKFAPLEKFVQSLYSPEYISPSSGKVKSVPKAWVEIEKEVLRHKKGPFFRAECQLSFAGKSVRSEATSDNLGKAITEVKNELQKMLKKEKEKALSKRRKSKK